MINFVLMVDGSPVSESTCFSESVVWAITTKSRLPDSEVAVYVSIKEDPDK